VRIANLFRTAARYPNAVLRHMDEIAAVIGPFLAPARWRGDA
jgi:hypothetical protein